MGKSNMGVGINLLYVRELYNRQSTIDIDRLYFALIVNSACQSLSVVSKIVTFFTCPVHTKFAVVVVVAQSTHWHEYC